MIQEPKDNKPKSIFRDATPEEFDNLDYDGFIDAYARRRKVPAKLVKAMFQYESSNDPHIMSDAKAVGIGQFMPDTAKRYGIDPTNKWESAVGTINYLEDSYKNLRPFAKDDAHAFQAAVAAYLRGDEPVKKALKAGKYLPDSDDDTDKYTGKHVIDYVDAIWKAYGGYSPEDISDQPTAQPTQLTDQLVEQPEGASVTFADKAEGVTVTNPVAERQRVVEEFGENSPEVREYDAVMKNQPSVSSEGMSLLRDSEKGLVKDVDDEARRIAWEEAEGKKNIARQMDAMEAAAHSVYKLTGRRSDYDAALQKELVGGVKADFYLDGENPTITIGTRTYTNVDEASEILLRQLGAQFTSDPQAIEGMIAHYKQLGNGRIRLFDTASGKEIEGSDGRRRYNISLPGDVAMRLRQAERKREEVQDSRAYLRYYQDSKDYAPMMGAIAKNLSFNGLLNQALGGAVSVFDEKLGQDLKTLGFNPATGQFFSRTIDDYGLRRESEKYAEAEESLRRQEIVGNIIGETIKLVTFAKPLTAVSNVAARRAASSLSRVVPSAVRFSQAGEITAAAGSITGRVGFTSAAGLEAEALQAVNMAAQLFGSTTSFAGLQTIAPQGYVVKTDELGKMLGLERAVMDAQKGGLRKETLGDLASTFGTHWMALAAFSALDLGATAGAKMLITNPASQKYMAAVISGLTGKGTGEALNITVNQLSPQMIRILGTAASSAAFTAINNPKALAGALSGDSKGLFDFASDYLMNVVTMGAMHHAKPGYTFQHPETGKFYELGKAGGEVYLREISKNEAGVNVVKPTTKLELDFLVKTYVDGQGSAEQRARVNQDFEKAYTTPEPKPAVRPVEADIVDAAEERTRATERPAPTDAEMEEMAEAQIKDSNKLHDEEALSQMRPAPPDEAQMREMALADKQTKPEEYNYGLRNDEGGYVEPVADATKPADAGAGAAGRREPVGQTERTGAEAGAVRRDVSPTATESGTGRGDAGGGLPESKPATVSENAPRNVVIRNKTFSTTGKVETHGGVEKVELTDSKGNTFFVDKDIVDTSQPALFRMDTFQVDDALASEAKEYAKSIGREYEAGENFLPDTNVLRKLGEIQEDLPHEPNNPEVQKAYNALKKETVDQYNFLKSKGVVFEPWQKEGQPYQTSKEMRQDVQKNKHLYFFTGGDMPGDHPLAEKTGVNVNGIDLTYNDVFRAVHDYFGHAVQGSQFGFRGEFNATDSHARMFSPEALPAMLGETVFQNSKVNFGRHLRRPDGSLPEKGDADWIPPGDRPYAEQKAINVTSEMVNLWKSAYGEATERAPLFRIDSLLNRDLPKDSVFRRVQDRVKKAVYDYRITRDSVDAALSGEGWTRNADDVILYDHRNAELVADAAWVANEVAKMEALAEGREHVDFVFDADLAGAMTLPKDAANRIGKYVRGDLGAIMTSTDKALAFINYNKTARTLNYRHESVHVAVSSLPLEQSDIDSISKSKTFQELSEQLKGGNYEGAEGYELIQEALAFGVTGDTKTFGRNVKAETLRKAAREALEALAKKHNVPVGEMKKFATSYGREVVRDIEAAKKTAKALGKEANREFLLRRAEILKDVDEAVFSDAKELTRDEFLSKYRGSLSYEARRAVLDSVGVDEMASLNPRVADEPKVYKLDHYSKSGRTLIDPQFAGTSANAGKEKIRKDRVGVSYYYLAGTKPETMFQSYPKGQVETELNLYDLSHDKLGLRVKMAGDASRIEKYLKENGFDGYWSPESDLDTTYRNIVAVFKPLEVSYEKPTADGAQPLFRKSSEVEDLVRQGDFMVISGNQSKKQKKADIARTASLKEELIRKGFEVLESQGSYLGSKENSLFIPLKTKKEVDLVAAIASAYKQESVFLGQSGKYTAPFTDGTNKEYYSKTSQLLMGEDSKKEAGFTTIKTEDGEVSFSTPDLYDKTRTRKPKITERQLVEAYAMQDKFTAKKPDVMWKLSERAKAGKMRANNIAEALQTLEGAYKIAHPATTKDKPEMPEQTARYINDYTATLEKILSQGLYEKKWYSDDLAHMTKIMEQAFPGIDAHKAAQQFFGLLLATTSARQKVKSNFNIASRIFTRFLETLEVPTHQESGAQYGIFTEKLEYLQKLFKGYVGTYKGKNFTMEYSPEFHKAIEKDGMRAVMDYLFSPTKNSPRGRDFNVQEILGMKLGSFMFNLVGEEHIGTIDSWMKRSWTIINGGTLHFAKNRKTGVYEWVPDDDPGDTLGDVMRGSMEAISNRLKAKGFDVSPVEVQALIWTHVKELTNNMLQSWDKSTFSLVAKDAMVELPDIGGTLDKFTGKYGTEGARVASDAGKGLYSQKANLLARGMFRKEGEYGKDVVAEKIFYSKLVRGIQEKLPDTMTRQQLEGFVSNPANGIKAEELYFTGLDDFILKNKDKGNKTIDKQELLDYLEENRVEIREVRSRDYFSPEEREENRVKTLKILDERNKLSDATRRKREELSDKILSIDHTESYRKLSGQTRGRVFELLDTPIYSQRRLVKHLLDTDYEAAKKAYGQEVLDGIYDVINGQDVLENLGKEYDRESNLGDFNPETGDFDPQYLYRSAPFLKNYKEVLFTTPEIYTKSDHYPIRAAKNTLATARVGEYTEGGKKYFVVDEIQSDHHQKGQKEGYQMPGEYGTDKPNYAPWTKTWPLKVLSKTLKEASDKGFDKVLVSTGDVQKDRYGLKKEFRAVTYNSEDMVLEYTSHTGEVGEVEATPEELASYLGDELARKLLSPPDVSFTEKNIHNDGSFVVITGAVGNDKMDVSVRKRGKEYIVDSDYSDAQIHDTYEDAVTGAKNHLQELFNENGHTIEAEGVLETSRGTPKFYDTILLQHLRKIAKRYGTEVTTKTITHKGKDYTYYEVPVVKEFSEEIPLFRKKSGYEQSEEDWINTAERSKGQPLNDKELLLIREAYQTGASEAELYEIADRLKMSVPRFLIKVYKANLLSGASTTASNTMGNLAMAGLEEVARIPTAVFDAALSKVMGEERTAGGASLRGITEGLRGLKTGWNDFIRDMKEEDPHSPYAYYSKSGYKALDNSIGKLADLTIRFVGGQDKIFGGYATRRAAFELAKLRAKREGISIEEAMKNPTVLESDLALRYGLYSTFNEENFVVNTYRDVRRKIQETSEPLGWYLDTKVPFIRTGTNIVNVTLDYLGVNGTLAGLQLAYKNIDPKSWAATKRNMRETLENPETRRNLAQLFGRGTVGLGLAYMAYALAQAGYIKINSFYEDDDYAGMNRRANENSSPMSIKIGDRWYGFGRLAPIGLLFAAGATMQDMAKGDNTAPFEFLKQTLATAPLGKAVSDATKPSYDKDKPAAAYLLPDPVGMVPASGMLRDIAQFGETKKETKVKGDWYQTQVNRIKDIVPGLRGDLKDKTSATGESLDVPNFLKGFSTKHRSSAALNELERLKVGLSAREDGGAMSQERKQGRQKKLEELVASEEYKKMSDADKKYALQYLIRQWEESNDPAPDKKASQSLSKSRETIRDLVKEKLKK